MECDWQYIQLMDDLKGKVALITGASRGIGRAIAVALAQAGADIAVNYHQHAKQAETVCDQIRSSGRRACAIQADVSQSAAVRQMLVCAEKELGSIGVLVNNAGIAKQQPIEDISETDWNQVIDTNLKSTFLVTQAVLPHMRQQRWGRIINISSVAAQTGGLVGPHYAASKAGMIGLTHSLANLLVKEGITVNAIAPALIQTDMVTSNPKASPAYIPVGRFGTADEVASVAVLLATNGYITGQTINVNGGWYLD
jgi:3-oxoacyl-[acyl-carrier protein] reductase